MFKIITLYLLTVAVLCLANSAYTKPIDDEKFTDSYIGANDHGQGDVMGPDYMFDIMSVDTILIGTHLYVDIHTHFVGHAGMAPESTSNGLGIGYGDLFLSTAWTPDPGGQCGEVSLYVCDNAHNGTEWGFAFSLDNRWSNSGGTGTLHAVTEQSLMLAEEFISQGDVRNGQEVAIDAVKAGTPIGFGTWSVDIESEMLSMIVDLGYMNQVINHQDNIVPLALHWGMLNANDVIEGQITLHRAEFQDVSLPATWGLVAIGLMLYSAFTTAVARSKRKA